MLTWAWAACSNSSRVRRFAPAGGSEHAKAAIFASTYPARKSGEAKCAAGEGFRAIQDRAAAARLAVDKKSHGQGFGSLLLVDAMTRVRSVAGQVGGYALFVDAKDTAAARFYSRYGFKALPSDPLLHCIPIASIPAVSSE